MGQCEILRGGALKVYNFSERFNGFLKVLFVFTVPG